jgi:hypothetical protein
MRIPSAVAVATVFMAALWSQLTPPSPSGTGAATVAATIDHNRVVINLDLPLPDGSRQPVRAWVDNGSPDLELSRRVATLLGLAVACDDKTCSAPAPAELLVGAMSIPLTGIKEAKIPLKPVSEAAVLVPGMNVDLNLPSSVLRHYDVLIDFPGHKFSIGAPGTIHFRGVSGKVEVDPNGGLIRVPSQIEGKKYSLVLGLGSSISFISEELLNKLATAHPEWSAMNGSVGSANQWGTEDEIKGRVMRLDRLQFGPLFLANPVAVSWPKEISAFYEKQAGAPVAGMVGSNLLLNYRVGLDYAHSLVYFDLGRTYNFPDFDVIGLVLRPEGDGEYTIVAVADIDGKPSVAFGPEGVQAGDRLLAVDGIPVHGSTMGQVWSLLGGTPGQQRVLTLGRAGKELRIPAAVEAFLPEAPDEKESRKKK